MLSLSKTHYPLLSTGSTQEVKTGNGPDMTEKLLTGQKASKQNTNKDVFAEARP